MYQIKKLPLKEDLETKAVLKATILAERALAELKGIVKTIPNTSILLTTLGLQEAGSSSEIENIVTTNDELFREQSRKEPTNPAAKEVRGHAEAMSHGYQIVQKHKLLSVNHICEIQAILIKNNAGFRTQMGTVLKNNAGKTVYTPPQDKNEIRDLMSNLTEYINEENGLNPLVKMAVIHHQFESIHPFYDGNGRVGRIINILYLVLHSLLDIPVLYLSRYIVSNKADYYKLLQTTRGAGSWEPWILYMLEGIRETAVFTTKKVKTINALMKEYKKDLREKHPKLYSQDLLNHLFSYPYTRIEFVAEELNCHRHTARSRLDKLQASGLLEMTRHKRQLYFINEKLLDCLIDKDGK